MGADIHAFIEYRHRKEGSDLGGWDAFHQGELSLGRHYLLFAALGGIRKPYDSFTELIPPRGLPDDAASDTFIALHYPIVEEANAPSYDIFNDWPHILRSQVKPEFTVIRKGDYEYVREEGYHDHSYLSMDEIHACLEHAELPLEKTDIWFQAAVAAMAKLDEHFETRLVFWFDN